MGLTCKLCGSDGELFAWRGAYLCYPCAFGNTSQSPSYKSYRPEKRNDWGTISKPKNIQEFIGQEHIKHELNIMMEAYKIHHIPLQHCLFNGTFGIGKTTLATLFADMSGQKYSIVPAHTVTDEHDLPNDNMVILDEIHMIKKSEPLLGVMDRYTKTIMGTTTEAGKLSNPFRSRFIIFTLRPYTVEELKIIINNVSNNLDYKCPEYLTHAIAQRSKSVARLAVLLFKRIYDRIVLEKECTPELIDRWFQEMGIDPDGLDNADRAYLSCLSDNPIGVQNISVITGLDISTLQEAIEPYLLTVGLVRRTPRGRILGTRKEAMVWN